MKSAMGNPFVLNFLPLLFSIKSFPSFFLYRPIYYKRFIPTKKFFKVFKLNSFVFPFPGIKKKKISKLIHSNYIQTLLTCIIVKSLTYFLLQHMLKFEIVFVRNDYHTSSEFFLFSLIFFSLQ